ncbi:MAG: VOC family protein [Acidimicrobiales bacterium]
MPAGIRLEIGIDCADPHALAPFWLAALGYERADGDGDPYLDLVPPAGSNLPVVYLQRVPEGKTVKNRMHPDLWTAEPQELVARLEALGASKIGRPFGREGQLGWPDAPPGSSESWWWQVMADPEGNELCVCREKPNAC